MSRIASVLNEPDLSLLGMREPAICGRETRAVVEAACRLQAAAIDANLPGARRGSRLIGIAKQSQGVTPRSA